MNEAIRVSQLTESPKVSNLTKLVVFLCSLVMLVDGYDTGSLSYAAPALVKQWGVSQVAIGSIFSVQLLGSMLGAFIFGFMADRFGRKPAIVLGTVLFGIFSLLTI